MLLALRYILYIFVVNKNFLSRINVLAKGHSGVSLKTLKQLIDAFNSSCLSWVPEQGTVGASGDLAPLSHLALGLVMAMGFLGMERLSHKPHLDLYQCSNEYLFWTKSNIKY